jgi:putative transcriptional regulator
LRLNVTRQTISKWEDGQSVPDAESLTQIAELLDIPVQELLGEKVNENKVI